MTIFHLIVFFIGIIILGVTYFARVLYPRIFFKKVIKNFNKHKVIGKRSLRLLKLNVNTLLEVKALLSLETFELFFAFLDTFDDGLSYKYIRSLDSPYFHYRIFNEALLILRDEDFFCTVLFSISLINI